MAKNTDKPTSSRKGKHSGSSSPANSGSSANGSSPAIRKEAKCWGAAAVGVLLLVAVIIPERVGVIGRFFHSLLLGLFGFGGLALPIALICFAVLGLVAKEINIPLVRSSILAWLILAWLHIIVDPVNEGYTGLQYLSQVYGNGSLLGGGVVGAILGRLFMEAIGRILSIIVIVVLIIVILMFITGRSFASLIGRGVDKARDFYDERASRQYDDYDFEDVDDTGYVQKRTKKDLEKKKPIGQKPLQRPNDIEQRAELIDIEDTTDEDEYTVLLIDEELNNLPEQKARDIPPFLRQGKSRRLDTSPKVLAFEENDGTQVYTHDENVIYGEPENEQYDEQDFFDQSQTYTGEQEGSSSLVVRGLVTGATNTSQPIQPLFETSGENDPVDYDEYAQLNRLAGVAPSKPETQEELYADFKLPSIDILGKNDKPNAAAESLVKVKENSHILEETLRSFRVEAKVVEVSVGPTVTRYDLAPGPGVKVSSIANLSNDLALSLAAQGIRIEAPIPGKSAVGIEIPNKEPQGVFLREIIESERFENFASKLAFAVGKDIAGNPVVADVADMPHLLIAGATGAGKSVCINTLIASVLYKARPDEVKLLMIDPKVVELSVYNGIPHLLIPVVTDPKKASGALNWAVQEMESRYNSFAETGCRDLKGYNRHLIEEDGQPLPQIVIIIDELADLMMSCKGEVEEAICRLAQKARAAGIHLIVATQRPSVDVITGLIKANIPSRLAFAVSSGTDSRTVLDMYGAEKLLGRGDMLFLPRGQNKPIRIQGGFISDKEVEQMVAFLKAQAPVEHTTEMIQQITMPGKANISGEVDEFFHDAVDFLLVKGKASTSMLQRQFRIGYNRASRLMDDLEVRGIVGPEDGVKPRKVTITREEYNEIYER